MLLEILILVLIITIFILFIAAAVMLHLLSDRKANIDAIFSNVEVTEKEEEYRKKKREDKKWLEEQPCEVHEIESYDGLKLRGKYLRALTPSDRCVICVHGFHSTGFWEYATIGRFYLENGINVLFIDQRASGASEGRMVTYGDREQKDVLEWARYAEKKLKENRYFALHGVSMGSATVTLVSDRLDDEIFKYIAADCGYTDEKEQLLYTIKSMKLPAGLLYQLYEWACRLIRLYNPLDIRPIDHVAKSRVPMIFAHGDEDPVVPLEMAKALYNACPNAKKSLIIGKGAGHTQAFFYNDEYGKTLLEYMK